MGIDKLEHREVDSIVGGSVSEGGQIMQKGHPGIARCSPELSVLCSFWPAAPNTEMGYVRI